MDQLAGDEIKSSLQEGLCTLIKKKTSEINDKCLKRNNVKISAEGDESADVAHGLMCQSKAWSHIKKKITKITSLVLA